ncbi:serine/threonine-protein kinase [Sorangium sp. So ce1151]|uniref:serine/threonine-protein kinase n=1 Tax=Sorangium sp. So ce1151 TaxID=3133332 RepID=UPI003F5E9CA7
MAPVGDDVGVTARQDDLPSTVRSPWFAGAVIAGRYRMERLLGEGGMGLVWAAKHTLTRRPVALKLLKATSTEARRRFLREARIASAVRHENVVEVYDVLELGDGSPVMVMELLSGESLAARLAREGRLPLGEVATMLLRVTAAVGTAHALGVIHRDLKPENIFLVDGQTDRVKVLDFGIAKLTSVEGDLTESAGLTRSGSFLGTPCYMAPEQAFGEREIDHRADIWSLGILLYECLSGMLPTRADNMGQVFKIIVTGAIPPLSEVAPDVPGEVASLVGRMLSRERHDRPADLIEVAGVLARHAGARVPRFGPPSAPAMDAPLPPRERAGPPSAGRGDTAGAVARVVVVGDHAGAGARTVAVRTKPARAGSVVPSRSWRVSLLAGVAGLALGGIAVRSWRSMAVPEERAPSGEKASFRLIIESVPSTASVLSGGKHLGATPLVISIENAEVQKNPLWLTLQRQGYEPASIEQGPSDDSVRIVVAMQRESAPGGPPR